MRLKFGADDWLHVIMAVRIAQKVLSSGKHKTASWDTHRGRFILDELTRLVKRNPGDPQVATKIDLTHLMDMLPDNEHAPIVASTAPDTAMLPDTSALERRVGEMEQQVVKMMCAKLEAPEVMGDADELRADNVRMFRRMEDLDAQNIRIYEFIAKLEDRVIAVERRKK